MHEQQLKLLKIINNQGDLNGMNLREIGALIEETHPQKIKHHLLQLEKRGLIKLDLDRHVVEKPSQSGNSLLSIPIMGSASCGPATTFAEEDLVGYLQVSDSLLPKHSGNLFAVRANGNSMDRANINGESLEDGDYAIIDQGVTPEKNDYILSIIDGFCNIKKLFVDTNKKQLVLFSESSQELPPIVIGANEFEYFINGKVIKVIKKQ